MILAAETLFWTSLLILFYTYTGYPIIVYLLNLFKPRRPPPTSASGELPSVTLIVAAYNEASVLPEKIANTLQLEYPAEKLKIIFVTDGSTDSSNELISEYPQITLLYRAERLGKLAAINRAMEEVSTDVVVFSDANSLLNHECIYNMVRHYSDPKVGGVAGEKKVSMGHGAAGGEGTYWRYESFLKTLDSAHYTVVGAAGELFSMRSHLYTPLPQNVVIEDFVQTLLLCKKGFVVRYEPKAFAVERASLSLADEKERKIRISAGGFQAMVMLRSLLNIFRFGRLSFLYISHRVLRWTLAPLALLGWAVSSTWLCCFAGGPVYKWALILQVVFYGAALAGAAVRVKIFYLPFYFCFMNLCVFAGFLRYVTGSQPAVWAKAQRPGKI